MKKRWTMDEGSAFIKNVFQQSADMVPNYNEGRLDIRFHINGHEADLKTVGRPHNKKWAVGAKPTLIIQGSLQEFLINVYQVRKQVFGRTKRHSK